MLQKLIKVLTSCTEPNYPKQKLIKVLTSCTEPNYPKLELDSLSIQAMFELNLALLKPNSSQTRRLAKPTWLMYSPTGKKSN